MQADLLMVRRTNEPRICANSTGHCLATVNVTMGSSLDGVQAQRFLPFNPAEHLKPDVVTSLDWYAKYRAETDEVCAWYTTI